MLLRFINACLAVFGIQIATRDRLDALETAATATAQENVTDVAAEIVELQDNVRRLQEADANRTRVQTRAVRRLFLLAQNVGKVINANNVTPGTPVGNDAVTFALSNDSGRWLEMDIYPFREIFVLRDASGVMTDVTFPLDSGENGDLTRATILMLNGFAEFATRNDPTQSDTVLLGTVNSELAPVSTDATDATTVDA